MPLIGKSPRLSNFRLLRQVNIPELNIEALEFVHEKTGAAAFHLRHASPEAFSIAFRTLPDDSTGLPHILEHTALCGSKTYPVRDPFFKMLDRSLSVYMNAWTGGDFTQYPFVTGNQQDYRNLRSVYLDAVFNPLLERDDFLQEGWRFELSDGDKVKLGGVVLNEMKGALSDADSFFLTRLQQARFPFPSVYSVVSGGDPLEISKLTHADLVAFHRHFYHPSNAVTVSSGRDDFDWQENLAALDESFGVFERRSIDTGRLWTRPQLRERRVTISGPPDALGDSTCQTRMIVSFLANEARDVDEVFAMKIMADLLFEGPASPFYQALIDSGLGSEYAPGSGYDSSTSHCTLSIGLQGIKSDAVSKVERVINETFQKVRSDVSKWLPRDRIESILHQLQLSVRYAPANFGLNLVAGVTQSWIHGAGPLASLSIDAKVRNFQKRLQQGGLFEELLDKYVLGPSADRLVFVMNPDAEHANKLASKESLFISEKKVDLEQVKQDSERLKQKQSSTQDLSVLPCLRVEDCPRAIRDPSLFPTTDRLFIRNTPESNGLVHFKAKLPINVNTLTSRQVMLLPLLLQAFSELGGAKRNSAAQFDLAVRASTGGLSFSTLLGPVEEGKADLFLLASSFSLQQNKEKMIDLLMEAMRECNIMGDLERLKSILSSSATSINNSIASAGNRFAASKASSLFGCQRAQVSEMLSGLTQAEFLNNELSEKDGIESLARELDELRLLILNGISNWQGLLVQPESDSNFEAHLESLFESRRAFSPTSNNFNLSQANDSHVHVKSPFSASYTALIMHPNLDPNESDFPAKTAHLLLTARLLRSRHLHREIREIGGAYGSASSFSALSGHFCFTSYRDPQPERSLRVFEESLDALLSRDSPSESDLLGAKLAVVSDSDAPVDLPSRGLSVFLYGHKIGNDARRQALRDALLSAKLSNIQDCLQNVLKPALKTAKSCILGQ